MKKNKAILLILLFLFPATTKSNTFNDLCGMAISGVSNPKTKAALESSAKAFSIQSGINTNVDLVESKAKTTIIKQVKELGPASEKALATVVYTVSSISKKNVSFKFKNPILDQKNQVSVWTSHIEVSNLQIRPNLSGYIRIEPKSKLGLAGISYFW